MLIKALSICTKGVRIRAGFLHEVKWYEDIQFVKSAFLICIQSFKSAS